MELSICVVSYQCKDKLRACLQSIRANRPPVEHEVIVVDNGSTDGTPEMLRDEFFWVRMIANPDNRGFSVACNQAVAAGSGRKLMMLNPDTEVGRDALDALLRFADERPWIGAVGPKLVCPDGEAEMSCREFPTLMNALWDLTGLSKVLSKSRVFGHFEMTWWDHAEPRAVDWLSGAAILFTREAWRSAGPLDEDFFLQAAELDWQKRLARKGLERWYLPSAEIIHHPGRSWGGDEAQEVIALHLAAFRYFRKHHGRLSAAALRLMAVEIAAAKIIWADLQSVSPSGRDEARERKRLNWMLLRAALGSPSGDAESEPPDSADEPAREHAIHQSSGAEN